MTDRRPGVIAAVLAVGLWAGPSFPSAAAAEGVSDPTRPSAAPTTRPVRLRDLMPPDPPDARQEAPTEQEWKDISDFAKANLPNRWALFEKLEKSRGPSNPLLAKVKLRIASRYRSLMRASTQAPFLYDRIEQQARLEDRAWGAAVEARHDPKDAAAKAKLHDAVGDLVRDVLDARSDRLDRLSRAVSDEQAQLEHDVKDTEGLVDAQVERLMNESADDDRPRNWGRRPGGWGGPGGFGPDGRRGPGGGPPSTMPGDQSTP